MEYFAQVIDSVRDDKLPCDALSYACGVQYPPVFSILGIICFVLLLILGMLLFGRKHTRGPRGSKVYTILFVGVATLLALVVVLSIWSVLDWRGIV